MFSLSGGLAAFAGGLLAPVINASPDVESFRPEPMSVPVLAGMGVNLAALTASLLRVV